MRLETSSGNLPSAYDTVSTFGLEWSGKTTADPLSESATPIFSAYLKTATDNNSIRSSYDTGFFVQFADCYAPVHLPLSVITCLFGIVANTLNVIVLTRRSMASPTNVLLTGLSAAQLFLLVNYLSLLIFNVCASSCLIPDLHSYSAVTYKWINVNISLAFHTIALSHTLVLATFRFLAIQTPTFARSRLNIDTARLCIITLYTIVPLLCSPVFLTSRVARIDIGMGTNARVCFLDEAYDLDYVPNTELLEAAMWIFGIFFKLVPSLAISILSLYMITSLNRYHKKKALLTGRGQEYRPLLMPAIGVLIGTRKAAETIECQSFCEAETGTVDRKCSMAAAQVQKPGGSQSSVQSEALENGASGKSRCAKKRSGPKLSTTNSRQRNNVTKMLVAVALLCVSVELPHGVVNLLTAIFGQSFGTEVYDNLGDFFEMLTLFYSSVNFVLYCIMSLEFQRTFKQIFIDPFHQAVVKKISRREEI